MQLLEKKNKKSRVFQITRSLKRLGRSLGCCYRNAIAKHAVNDKKICDRIVKLLGKKVQAEMKRMCLLSTDSVLRNKDPESFNLGDVYKEMEQHAPITKSILESCLSGRRKSSATELKRKGRTKSRMADKNKVVSVCCAILLRARSQRMNALQKVVSLILYCGHASKRVSKYSCVCYCATMVFLL